MFFKWCIDLPNLGVSLLSSHVDEPWNTSFILTAMFQDQKRDAVVQKRSLGLSLSLRLAQQCYTGARPYYPSDVGQARAISLSRFRNPHRLTSVQTIPNGCLYSSQSCQLKSKRHSLWNICSHFKVEWPQAEAAHRSWPCTGSLRGCAHMAKFSVVRSEIKLYVGKGSWLSSSGTWQVQILQAILWMILLRCIYHLQVCPKI